MNRIFFSIHSPFFLIEIYMISMYITPAKVFKVDIFCSQITFLCIKYLVPTYSSSCGLDSLWLKKIIVFFSKFNFVCHLRNIYVIYANNKCMILISKNICGKLEHNKNIFSMLMVFCSDILILIIPLSLIVIKFYDRIIFILYIINIIKALTVYDFKYFQVLPFGLLAFEDL